MKFEQLFTMATEIHNNTLKLGFQGVDLLQMVLLTDIIVQLF